MTWFRPGYGQSAGTAKAGFPGIIHEKADQLIQGGRPGEHYHLSALQLTLLFDRIQNFRALEPAMVVVGNNVTTGDATSDFVTILDGDIVMVPVDASYGLNFNAVVGAPVVVPPDPSGDEFWGNVLILFVGGGASNTTTGINKSPYPVSIFSQSPSGVTVTGHYKSTPKRFGYSSWDMGNIAVYGAGGILRLTSSEAMYDAFTAEIDIYFKAITGIGFGDYWIVGPIPGLGYAYRVDIQTNGKPRIRLFNNVLYVGAVTIWDYEVEGFLIESGQWYTFCVERDDAKVTRFYINDTLLYTSVAETSRRMILGNMLLGEPMDAYLCNARLTKDAARYAGARTNATAPYPEH